MLTFGSPAPAPPPAKYNAAVLRAVWIAGGTTEPPWMFSRAVMYWCARMMYWLPFGGVLNRLMIVWPPSNCVFGWRAPAGHELVWFLYQPWVYVQWAGGGVTGVLW